MTDEMTPYERDAWIALQEDHRHQMAGQTRKYLPAAIRAPISEIASRVADGARHVPGADLISGAVTTALGGLNELGSRLVSTTVDPNDVVKSYRRAGHEVDALSDIRDLPLEVIDNVRPRFDLRYGFGSAVQGAIAAAVVTGADVLAAGETVATAGVAAAPGVGQVLAAITADSVGVLLASQRAVAQVAAFYGYDVSVPEERVISAGVLGVGFASASGKAAAYRELNSVVQGLARRQTWQQLNEHAATKIVQQVFRGFGFKLTKDRLAEAIPVLGIAVASGMNARTLLSVVDGADRYYRSRLLGERYDVHLDAVGPAEPVASAEETISIVDIIDAELEGEQASPPTDAKGIRAATDADE